MTATEPTRIRTLIVDDEPLARERLRTLLGPHADVQIVGECTDGLEALAAIGREHPDLVFLDVQMPGLDGFGVVEKLGAEAEADPSAQVPAVVFVTAHDDHALRAFEHHALDYLLKPFDQARFEKALGRARKQVGQARATQVDSRLLSLLEGLNAERKHADRILVRTANRMYFVRTEDIDWVEASGNYVRVHAGGQAHLIRETMRHMEERLDARRFVRIHRSAIVNVDRIQELEPWLHGEYIVILRDGTRLTASRVFSDRLEAVMG